MVKRRANRIELGENERALICTRVCRGGCGRGGPTRRRREEFFACLSCHDEPHPSIIEMKAFCASHLPAYMSPDRFVFLDTVYPEERGVRPGRVPTCLGSHVFAGRRRIDLGSCKPADGMRMNAFISMIDGCGSSWHERQQRSSRAVRSVAATTATSRTPGCR